AGVLVLTEDSRDGLLGSQLAFLTGFDGLNLGVDGRHLGVPRVPLALFFAGEGPLFGERGSADFLAFFPAGQSVVDHLLEEGGLLGHENFFLSVFNEFGCYLLPMGSKGRIARSLRWASCQDMPVGSAGSTGGSGAGAGGAVSVVARNVLDDGSKSRGTTVRSSGVGSGGVTAW